MLLVGRIYKTDTVLFEKFLVSFMELDQLQIGPTFNQQAGSGGDGIPDALIYQPSFRIVVEAKLEDSDFWGKERYTSHFNNESTRNLLTLSKRSITEHRLQEFKSSLDEYDKFKSSLNTTLHKHLTYTNLIFGLRHVVNATRTRFKIELDELIDDYESFLTELGLIDDEHLRMHVVPVGQTYELNLSQKLYYNQTRFNYSAHKYIGLYFHKEVRYIGEPKVVLIPNRKDDGSIGYTFLKGEGNFTEDRKAQFEIFLNEFVADEGYGDDGGLRYHLVDEWVPTHFLKQSYGGIMGPRHCYLPDYIAELTVEGDAEYVAAKLDNAIWHVG